jgi:DNA polymerase-3 subunit gamma/tau
MSYQVLARKWRPGKFAEMVGQEHVLRALINALDNERLHHAYLFTGTRGVGKTTVARIFAKSLNCESGVSAEPCGHCSACVEIDEGRFVDLIEVDAASRTKVEDTRELLDNVQYAPTRGRYKVYLVDEVHMLSAHSFNALLKTLEEPPPHVKFLLATTDPQKLPATVLSRCLQFNLKRLSPDLIVGHLEYLLKQEGIETDAVASRLLARAADGSMRDALSLMDQAIAFGGGTVREGDVRTMLGSIEQGHVIALLQALASQDGPGLLAVVDELSQQAPDYEGLLADLIHYLQQLAVAQIVPEAVDEHLDQRERVLELANRLSAEDVQLYYQIALIGRRDLMLSPDLRAGLEMILLRMLAFRPDSVSADAASAGNGQPVAAAPAVKAPAAPRPAAAHRQVRQDSPPVAPPSDQVAVPAVPAPATDQDWSSLVAAMRLGGVVRELAMNCCVNQRDELRWELTLDPDHQQLLSKDREARLQKSLCECLQKEILLEIKVRAGSGQTPARQRQELEAARQADAIAAIETDPNVQALQEVFDATVHRETIRPRDGH